MTTIKEEGETKIKEWVVYYLDKGETKTMLLKYDGSNVLHSTLFHFNQQYIVTSLGVRESTVIKKIDSEVDVSEEIRWGEGRMIDLWKEKHNQ